MSIWGGACSGWAGGPSAGLPPGPATEDLTVVYPTSFW